MNNNTIITIDFETGSRNPRHTQPLQLAAIAIDSRKLELIPNSIFKTYIKPIDACTIYNLDPIEDEALEVNKITKEQLNNAPTIDVVWPQFTKYIEQFNTKKNKFTAPIMAGYNILKFDKIIVDRLCGGQEIYFDKQRTNHVCFKEPYKFGPWDEVEQEQRLFHPRDKVDVMNLAWYWLENLDSVTSLSFDAMRDFVGLTKDYAHNAIADTVGVALLLIRFLKLSRRMRINFKSNFDEENQILQDIMKNV